MNFREEIQTLLESPYPEEFYPEEGYAVLRNYILRKILFTPNPDPIMVDLFNLIKETENGLRTQQDHTAR